MYINHYVLISFLCLFYFHAFFRESLYHDKPRRITRYGTDVQIGTEVRMDQWLGSMGEISPTYCIHEQNIISLLVGGGYPQLITYITCL